MDNTETSSPNIIDNNINEENEEDDGNFDLIDSQNCNNSFDEVDHRTLWEFHENGNIPDNAVYAGINCYVIRAMFKGQRFIGSIIKGDCCATIPFRKFSHSKYEYQVLLESKRNNFTKLKWEWTDGRTLPEGAIIGGLDNAQILFIGRAAIKNQLLVGSFRLDNGLLYVPYKGEVRPILGCDILCNVEE